MRKYGLAAIGAVLIVLAMRLKLWESLALVVGVWAIAAAEVGAALRTKEGR